MTNEVLIRLKPIDNEYHIINCFYTEHPDNYLKMYTFCKKEEIPLQAKDMNNNDIIGDIDSIDVYFGGGENIPCIDVWIKKLG